MIHILEGIAVTVGAAAILAVTGGLIRVALIVRDTQHAAASLLQSVAELQDGHLDHERRLAQSEGFQRAMAGWLGGGGRHR